MAAALEPEAVVVDRALLQPVMKVMGWGAAVGILWMLRHFVRATVGGIAGLIGHTPWIGPILSSPVNAVEHWMDTEFGRAEAACDAQMAEGLHALARLIERIGHDFRTHGTLLYQLAQVMTHPLSISAYRALFAAEWKATAGIRDSIRHSTVGYIGAAIAYRLRPIYGELHQVERWTYPKVKHAIREVNHTIPAEVAGLWKQTKTIEGELSRLWDAIRKNEGILATLAFTGAVALALDKLGLNWIKCKRFGRWGNAMCGANGAELEALVGALVTVEAIMNFRELVKLAQSVEHGVAVGLRDLSQV